MFHLMPTNLQWLQRNDSIHDCSHIWNVVSRNDTVSEMLISDFSTVVQEKRIEEQLLFKPVNAAQHLLLFSHKPYVNTCNGERPCHLVRRRTYTMSRKKSQQQALMTSGALTTSLFKHVIYCINKRGRGSLPHKTLNKFLANTTCHRYQGTHTHKHEREEDRNADAMRTMAEASEMKTEHT